ncbi:hypothetical protein A3K72_02685 [Candidatus Woesearchaeota archaeon RBG_13_36_6]|nr:MAG: hypothetical protein A3K72_02685 [Candidatus Woesearchaeota archaeon RBG_13_36_6]
MGFRGIIRDIFLVYLGFLLLKVWIFKAPFTNYLGFLVIVMMLLSAWFFLERLGLLPKFL